MAMVNDFSVEGGYQADVGWLDVEVVAVAKKAVRALREYPILRRREVSSNAPMGTTKSPLPHEAIDATSHSPAPKNAR
jgi:hypothetical protein